jgi:hypothetical protein
VAVRKDLPAVGELNMLLEHVCVAFVESIPLNAKISGLYSWRFESPFGVQKAELGYVDAKRIHGNP